MPLSSSSNSSRTLLLVLAFSLQVGCAVPPSERPAGSLSSLQTGARIYVAFSPEAGAEALVLKVIDSAQRSLRLAGYSFTSPAVVRALVNARKRGVDVKVLLDDRGNRGKASIAAMNLIAGADIPVRVISSYAIHHDKYIVVDGRHTETGSFNYSQAAARSNSENVLVVWNDERVASSYLAHWDSRWAQGVAVEVSF
ncbi:phospholipase D family protein [Variovorax sp. LG9.2]|uniref:phospholipase D family nuclease n=1 Tax=Variovorax sp. LG9.2 TaxID=3048626 RepID=UPI002B222FB0|nr:phospholipase D family protein [Variovorax sp. LG9.2]MEB0056486.1 phospholipase D family protein [Variovorax sp. LG9.2]